MRSNFRWSPVARELSRAAREAPGVYFLPLRGAAQASLQAWRRWDGRLRGVPALSIAPLVGSLLALRAWLCRQP
ncbi:hypothetical protein GCM10009080_57910 [Cupriavidus pauculus]